MCGKVLFHTILGKHTNLFRLLPIKVHVSSVPLLQLIKGILSSVKLVTLQSKGAFKVLESSVIVTVLLLSLFVDSDKLKQFHIINITKTLNNSHLDESPLLSVLICDGSGTGMV